MGRLQDLGKVRFYEVDHRLVLCPMSTMTWDGSDSDRSSPAGADKPVMLPPGRASDATRPLPTGSESIVKTMGMIDVACLNAGTAVPNVTMTSTLSRMNSTAISA